MTRRIIIENRSQLDDTQVLLLVADIVSEGRCEKGGQQYRRHSHYCKRYDFHTTANKGSDRFLITNIDETGERQRSQAGDDL